MHVIFNICLKPAMDVKNQYYYMGPNFIIAHKNDRELNL